MTRTDQLLEASRELFNDLPRPTQQKHLYKLARLAESLGRYERAAVRFAGYEGRVSYALASPAVRFAASLLMLAARAA